MNWAKIPTTAVHPMMEFPRMLRIHNTRRCFKARMTKLEVVHSLGLRKAGFPEVVSKGMASIHRVRKGARFKVGWSNSGYDMRFGGGVR